MEIPLIELRDRRRSRRLRTLEEHGITGARVRFGDAVVVRVVSATGALVETSRRLIPGSTIELLLAGEKGHISIRGRVLRCVVWRLGPRRVSYRSAIEFDGQLDWFCEREREGSLEPGRGQGAADTDREWSTRQAR